MSEVVLGITLIAIVLLFSALASGLVERAPLSFPMIFLGLGLVLGGGGLGVVAIDAHTPILEVVATVSLSLVLFLDAVNLQVDELGSDWRLPMLSLGPGTLLSIAAVAAAAYLLMGTTADDSARRGAVGVA